MAKTTIPANLVKQIWAKKVFKEGLKESFFEKFTSTSGNNVVHVNKDTKTQKGNRVTFALALSLTGTGTKGNNATLRGNEEALQLKDFFVETELIRHAVVRDEADDQKTEIEMLPLIKSALVQWFSDWKDNLLIQRLSATPTAGEVVYAGAASAVSALTANDKLTCKVISRAKRKAAMHAPKVKPIKVDGKDKYIMLVGTWAARDLKEDPVWIAAQQNANARGSTNPIFSGALGEYDGVILYEYERVLNNKTGAASANVVSNLLLGQQAACFAVSREMRHISQTDDYGNVQGNGVSFYGNIEKTKFDGKDYGVINVLTGGAVE